MNESIKTTGQLRGFLAELMVGLKNGTVELETASGVTKIAGQINESFYAEIKVGKLRAESGEDMPGLGNMTIGDRGITP